MRARNSLIPHVSFGCVCKARMPACSAIMRDLRTASWRSPLPKFVPNRRIELGEHGDSARHSMSVCRCRRNHFCGRCSAFRGIATSPGIPWRWFGEQIPKAGIVHNGEVQQIQQCLILVAGNHKQSLIQQCFFCSLIHAVDISQGFMANFRGTA